MKKKQDRALSGAPVSHIVAVNGEMLDRECLCPSTCVHPTHYVRRRSGDEHLSGSQFGDPANRTENVLLDPRTCSAAGPQRAPKTMLEKPVRAAVTTDGLGTRTT